MRQEQKEATRRRVLAAAQACFAEHGYESSTIARIARTANVSVGTVHAHYADKVSLLAASLFDEIEVQLQGAWRGTVGRGALERLEHAVRALYQWYASDVPRSRTLLAHTLFLQGPWQERFDAQVGRFVAEVAGAFEAGIAQGELPPGGPSQLLAAGFMNDYLATLVGALRSGPFDVEPHVARVMQLTRLRCGLD